MLVPYWLMKTLCVVCFILNSISIFLSLSALFLLLMAFFNFGHFFADITESADIQPTSIDSVFNLSLWNLPLGNNSEALPMSDTTLPPSNNETIFPVNLKSTSHDFAALDTDQQLPLIVYLLFYLATAIVGLYGAHTFYNHKKIYFLISHVLLLFVIICFNLIAWFEFRAYSPLSTSPYEDNYLLLASLFDFINILVALCLLTALITNRLYVGHKQRNSIGPVVDSANSSE